MTLIDRLSKLEGPNREVDAEIVFDLLATPVGQHKGDSGPIGYIDLTDQPSWNLGLRFPGKDKAWFAATRKQIKGETLLIERDNAYVLMNSIRVPKLTASVDAAIALAERVLPGCRGDVEFGKPDDEGLYCARIYLTDRAFKDFHKVPAIALCIAILRAKEASK